MVLSAISAGSTMLLLVEVLTLVAATVVAFETVAAVLTVVIGSGGALSDVAVTVVVVDVVSPDKKALTFVPGLSDLLFVCC